MNAPRRTLTDNLPPRQRAFLTVADGPEPLHYDFRPEADAAIDPQRPKLQTASDLQIANDPQTANPSYRPEPLRSVTIRLPVSVADDLRRESIKRSLDYLEPFSQQAIVESAVRSWLKTHGCQCDD